MVRSGLQVLTSKFSNILTALLTIQTVLPQVGP